MTEKYAYCRNVPRTFVHDCSPSTSCICKGNRYKVPHPRKIPSVLKNLTTEEIYALRPFRAFSGKYSRMMFGYRVQEEPFINGQEATILNNHTNTLLLQFPNSQKTFTHPVTTVSEDGFLLFHYPLNPAYAMTICKTQGANMKQLVVWFDSHAPKGMGYVALSQVRKK